MQRRIFEMVELQQSREKVDEKSQLYRAKIKNRFDGNIKDSTFSVGEMVLRWDARKDKRVSMVSLTIFGLALFWYQKF